MTELVSRTFERDLRVPVTAHFETPGCLVPTVDWLCPLQTVTELKNPAPKAKVRPSSSSKTSSSSRALRWLGGTAVSADGGTAVSADATADADVAETAQDSMANHGSLHYLTDLSLAADYRPIGGQ